MDNSGNIFREVNEKSDIVKVIAYYLGSDAIVKAGKKYKSICPFHNDSHPSMQIDPEKKFFHCFSCDAGGDTIKFVEKYAHLSSLEALRKVCEICCIPLPADISSYHEKKDVLREKFPEELDALSELCRFYQLFLQSNDGHLGRKYLEERGIARETIEHFGIGFSPFDPTIAIRSLRNLGYDVPVLERAGILSNSAELKDRYCGRIMFPIRDNDGHVVGFSGRKIQESQDGGKYINYPETELFRKSAILYHFDSAKESARRDGYVYLLEGFMDVIAMQRAGLPSAVGLMGTALTEEHLLALEKLKVEVRLLLDSDEAGQLGEERALPLLLKHRIPTRICWKFDKAKDADEVLTKEGMTELVRQAHRLYSPTMFLLGRKLAGRKALEDSKDLEEFIETSRPYILAEGEVSRIKDLKAIAKRTGLDSDTLQRLYSRPNRESTADQGTEKSFRPIRKKRREGQNDYSNVRRTFDVQLAGRYAAPEAFEKLFGYLGEALHLVIDKEKDVLYREEYGICFVLPQSREAYETFRKSRMVFDIEAFNVFADLVGNIYLEDQDLLRFGKDEYDRLLSSLSEGDAGKGEEDEADPFDLDGLEGSDVDLGVDEKAYLSQIVEIQKNLTQSWYDSRKFQRSIDLAKKLFALRHYDDTRSLRKSSSEGETREERLKRRKMVQEIKKASQNI